MQAATYLLIYVITVVNLNYLCLADPVLMCYYPSTARLRTNIAKFEIKDINFTLCTHYIYISAQIEGTTKTLAPFDSSVEEGPSGLYSQFMSAKTTVPSIKTLLSLGIDEGYCYRLIKSVGENGTILSSFIRSAVTLLRKHGFDGLEISVRYVESDTKIAHTNILKALREKFDEDTNDRLILTAAGPAMELYIDRGYDVVSMATSVDYAVISTDELFSQAVHKTQFHTPLFSIRPEQYLSTLSVNYSLHAWNSRGMPFNKMVVGLTGRGRFYELVNRSVYEPWAPVKQVPKYGPFFGIINDLTYIEYCGIANQTRKYYARIQHSPYMVVNDTWVGYDDGDSLKLKIQWVMNLGVAGVMFFGLDEDDFLGTLCGKGKYPLVVAMKNALTRQMSMNATGDTEHNSNTTMSPPGANVTDKDNVAKDTTQKHSDRMTKKYSNIISNLLYGFLYLIILIVCLGMAFLCGKRQRHQGE